MELLNFDFDQWRDILLPLGVAAITVLCALLFRRFAYRQLARWTAKTSAELGDIIVRVTRGPSLIWCFLAGIYLAVTTSKLPENWGAIANKVLVVLLIFSITWSIANLVAALIRLYAIRAKVAVPLTSLTQNIVKAVVLLIGVLIILDSLHIEITSLLAALGIGSLAVALALQETLTNVFAGAYIVVSGHVKAGDYIKLDTGDEGYVADIGWRATRIRTLPNNIVIIPNSKLAQSIVTNYYLPEKRMSLLIPINVSYDSDPEKVEKLLVEETKKAVGEVPGLLGEPAPFVRFIPGFGDFSLGFTLICQVREFVDQYLVQHELRKRIFKRFRAEGIEIPFPIRTVYIREKAPKI